jgi:hypothetical protein
MTEHEHRDGEQGEKQALRKHIFKNFISTENSKLYIRQHMCTQLAPYHYFPLNFSLQTRHSGTSHVGIITFHVTYFKMIRGLG